MFRLAMKIKMQRKWEVLLPGINFDWTGMESGLDWNLIQIAAACV